MADRLFVLLQYLLPQQLLSRLVGRLARSRHDAIGKPFIRWFARRYRVDMSEAANSDPLAYANFIDFFTRPLKPGARPLAGDSNTAVSPADGRISQLGDIEADQLLQAKGRHYAVQTLLGDDTEATAAFTGGQFITVYLSPRDYHRVHMPLDGTLTAMHYVPGQLFSVNDATARHVPNLFARNERVVCLFDTAQGPMAMVLVGAMIVAGIETVWRGEVCPATRQAFSINYRSKPWRLQLKRGEEMGRFKLGSTVIVLFGAEAQKLAESLQAGDKVVMGQSLATD